ncbi:MAG: hypothetical protein U0359_07275 [Byssovorax sp.]
MSTSTLLTEIDRELDDELRWQRLWLAAQKTPWSSLVLLPIGEGVPAAALSTKLAKVGEEHLGGTVVALDSTNVTLSTLKDELSAFAERARCAGRAIVAVPPLPRSPAGLTLAQAADAVILCVGLGESEIAEAQQILEGLDRSRVLGAIVLSSEHGREAS